MQIAIRPTREHHGQDFFGMPLIEYVKLLPSAVTLAECPIFDAGDITRYRWFSLV